PRGGDPLSCPTWRVRAKRPATRGHPACAMPPPGQRVGRRARVQPDARCSSLASGQSPASRAGFHSTSGHVKMTATMKRRACGRDFALSARMGVTTLLLCGLYLAALVPPLWLFHEGILPAKFAFGFDAVVLLLFVLQYRSLDGTALRASHARIVEDAEAPKLHAVLEKLAGLADVPKPRAAVIESEMPNA